MEKFESTGGAKIGMANATWPFAKLKVSKDKLELNASIIGNFVFQPKDIISIETYTMIPLLGQGIKINHRISNYNSKVIFWTIKNPSIVLNQIRQTGFLEDIDGEISESDTLIIKQQQSNSFPIKKTVIIGVIVFWNILLIYDFINFSTSDRKGILLGNGAIIALSTLLMISIASLISKNFSKLILNEGRSIEDVKKFLFLLIFVSGFMLLQLLIFKSI